MKKRGFLSVVAALFAVSTAFIGSGVAHAGTQTCTWSGAGSDSNWSTAANWSCDTGTVPADGGALVFPYGTPGSVSWGGGPHNGSNNDLSALNTYTSISFTKPSSCSDYMIIGNTVKLAGNITDSNDGTSSCRATIMTGLDLGSDVTISGTSMTLGDFSLAADHPIALNGHNLTFSFGGLSYGINVYDSINGNGNVIADGLNNNMASPDGFAVGLYGNSTFTGTVSAINHTGLTLGYRYATSTPLGASSNSLTIGKQSHLDIQRSFASSTALSLTIPQNIGFTADSVDSYNSSMEVGSGGCGTSWSLAFSPDDQYLDCRDPYTDITISGTLTIARDFTVSPNTKTVTFTGPVVGAYHILVNPNNAPSAYFTGNLVLASSSNGSLTANGTYQNTSSTLVLSDSQPTRKVIIGGGYTVSINGQRDCVGVISGGVLKGTGTLGCLQTQGGIVAPGNSPGTLNSGNVTFDSTSTLQEELGGTAAGQFDQLNVTGTVDLGGATLDVSLYNSYAPALNSTYTIVNNDSTDAITGTFAGLVQGASFVVGGYTYTISYTGGDGNDVVLTVAAVPAPPNTAGVLANPANIALGASVVALGFALLVIRRVMVKRAVARNK